MNKKRKNKGDLKDREKLQGIRIPRPMGLTLQLSQSHKKQEELLNIKIRVIEQWTTGGMRLNERTYSLEQISQYLNMQPSIVMKYMWKSMNKMGNIFNTKDSNEQARVIFSYCLKLGLEISSEMANQVQILSRSQAGQYKPFLSSAVNQALANWNSSQSPLLALLKTLTDKQQTNILINNQIQQNTHQHVTSDEAIKIINSKVPSMLEDPIMASNKIATYAESLSLPDLNPNTQNIALITKPKLLSDTLIPQSQANRMAIHTSQSIHPNASNPLPNPSSHPNTQGTQISNPISNKGTHSDKRLRNKAIEEIGSDEDFRI